MGILGCAFCQLGLVPCSGGRQLSCRCMQSRSRRRFRLEMVDCRSFCPSGVSLLHLAGVCCWPARSKTSKGRFRIHNEVNQVLTTKARYTHGLMGDNSYVTLSRRDCVSSGARRRRQPSGKGDEEDDGLSQDVVPVVRGRALRVHTGSASLQKSHELRIGSLGILLYSLSFV